MNGVFVLLDCGDPTQIRSIPRNVREELQHVEFDSVAPHAIRAWNTQTYVADLHDDSEISDQDVQEESPMLEAFLQAYDDLEHADAELSEVAFRDAQGTINVLLDDNLPIGVRSTVADTSEANIDELDETQPMRARPPSDIPPGAPIRPEDMQSPIRKAVPKSKRRGKLGKKMARRFFLVRNLAILIYGV